MTDIRTYFVYTLADPETGLVRYVGQTVDLKRRIGLHLCLSKHKRTYKEKWVQSLIESGKKPVVDIVWQGPFEEVDRQECNFIALFKSIGARLTNATMGGHTTRGRKCSEETKEKFRKMFTGICSRPPISDKEKAALSERSKGVVLTESQKKHLREQRKIGSEYWDQNAGARKNLERFTAMRKANVRRVLVSKDGVSIEYNSPLEASKATNVYHTSVYDCLNGIYKQTKGFTFKYIENEL